MSEEPITLREFLLALINERDQQYRQRFDAQEKATGDALTAVKEATAAALTSANTAVTKAELANERRFESVNEFRGALRDQQGQFITRPEYDTQHTALEQRTAKLEAFQNRVEGGGQVGRNSAEWVKYAITLVVGIAVTLLAVYLGKK